MHDQSTNEHDGPNPFDPPKTTAIASTNKLRPLNRVELRQWAFVGGVMGLLIPVIIILLVVVATVVSSHRVQGQLYHEDGPETFFIASFAMMFIFGIANAVVGAIVATALCVIRRAIQSFLS